MGFISLAIVGFIAGFVILDIRKIEPESVEGTSRIVKQAEDSSPQVLRVDEPTYTLELPSDWKEVKRVNNSQENSITWESTQRNEDSRFLTVHVDKLPLTKPVNRLMPVEANSNMLIPGDMSANCSTFTQGGTMNAIEAQRLKETPAKWQGIDFICNLPQVVNNEIGTGSKDGVNAVVVEGATKGKHTYFFLFTDHSVQPNYSIFREIIRSFKAK